MERAEMIQKFIESGQTQSSVARILGISKQAVNQILNRHKLQVRQRTHYSVKKGYIKKPLYCSICNLESKLEGHHTDYGVEAVQWLCIRCHKKVHLGEARKHTSK